MNTGVNLPAILIANLMGFILNLLLLSGGRWKIAGSDKDKKYIRIMLICSMAACVSDPVSFLLDGHPGALCHIAVYATDLCGYCCNLVLGPVWLYLLSSHLTGGPHRPVRCINAVLCTAGILSIAVNFFIPVIFSVDSANVYHRGNLFWLYLVFESIYVLLSLATYIRCKMRGGILKFFPVLQFLLPALVGIAIQSAMYGVSTIWPFISISIVCLVSSLQNELLYRDELTGLFNRMYLTRLKHELDNAESGTVTGMMMDMNGFKSINDRFGHSEGDLALKETAGIIFGAVGARGNVIRYGGDEFIVLLNTSSEDEAKTFISNINARLESYNQSSGKPYSLSVSIGYRIMDMKAHTMDELMHEVDQQMYENKRQYYSSHPNANRRSDR